MLKLMQHSSVGWTAQYARSKYPTLLTEMSVDEILDLTADAFSSHNNQGEANNGIPNIS